MEGVADQPAGTVKTSVILAFLPRNKTNYSPSQPPHCPLGSGLKLSELPHMAPHVWLCHSIRKPLKRHFLSLICIFLLSLICSQEHKDFLCPDLFSYMPASFLPLYSIVHLFTIFRSRKQTTIFVCSRFDTVIWSILFLFAFVWYVCVKSTNFKRFRFH